MKRGKPTLEDYVNAILERDEGVPYSEVLYAYDISPTQFYKAVMHNIEEYIKLTDGRSRRILTEIADDEKRKIELFNMGEEFVKMQYDRISGKIPGEKQRSFYFGSFLHHENVKSIVYYALTSNIPDLAYPERKRVIEAMKNLPPNLVKFMREIKIMGLAQTLFRGEDSHVWGVINIFDEVYREKTGEPSLFDLNNPVHIHKWGGSLQIPNKYWDNIGNRMEAVYHSLVEDRSAFASKQRTEVIDAIKNLPKNMAEYFQSIGLGGLMSSAFKGKDKNSPLKVLELYDRAYQEKTGDASLFDLSEKYHLHRWGSDITASNSFWDDPLNVEDAVYHSLTENNPKLKSKNREEVVGEIKKLPTDLSYYLGNKIGLSGLMRSQAFKKEEKGSPLAILEIFDTVYQRMSGDVSLFDLNQEIHLHRWGDKFQAPRSYWRNKENIEEAVYHVLTENFPKLKSEERKSIIEGINNLPINLYGRLQEFGLSTLLTSGLGEGTKGNHLTILSVFDKAYQKKTSNPSLFDLTQKEHAHKWKIGGSVPDGYWEERANINEAVYHTLTENHPKLASRNRGVVINGIQKLPIPLQPHFEESGLSGLMAQRIKTPTFPDGIVASPLAIVELFDLIYQQETGDSSLFDLEQEEHLHKWDVAGHVPNSYWLNPVNVEETAYHILTEKIVKLKSNDRVQVVETIKSLPKQLNDYFSSLGLASLMMHGFKEESKGSGLCVIEAYDKVYQRNTGDVSLFSLDNKHHLHRWDVGGHAPQKHWSDTRNIEEAIYHTLIEYRPELKANNRQTTIEALRKLPKPLNKFLTSIGLHQGVITPHKALEVFDKVYQRISGDVSLFDRTQIYHL